MLKNYKKQLQQKEKHKINGYYGKLVTDLLDKEIVKFNFNEDIIYQIEMMSYMEYNDKLCSINEHLGEIYTYQDLNDTEQAQLQYEKDLSYKAIKQLQNQLQQKENIIKEAREYIESNNFLYNRQFEKYDKLLAILDKETK